MVSFCFSLLLTHFPPWLLASYCPSAHPEASVPLGMALSYCGLPTAGVPQGCPCSGIGHPGTRVPSEVFCDRTPLSGFFFFQKEHFFQECVSSCVPSKCPLPHFPPVSPQVCTHITAQVSPHISLASGSFHPFLNTSEDHALL